MIPEREREALMRLTMCARNECVMCKYKDSCDSDVRFEFATKHMNILADALLKTESNSEKPNNCEDLQDWKDRMWAEAIVTEPTISKMEQVGKPQNGYQTFSGTSVYVSRLEDEPKTERSE